MKAPELLAPAGSFLAAYHAFKAGADGVYAGLREFSARKAAQNFSLDQLRRIRRLAAEGGKRVYVTINTVVREEEMGRLAETLAWLEALEVDGVIVQDLGVCDLITRQFPRIPIHASTQMAVHNDAGLRMAKDLGITRVILSRELPLDRIRELRETHPDIELEVFIHGALCYSFSGACLASWALTGRSGNRGDCAQICRSLFHCGQPERDGHFFSCRDLFLGREVLKLAEIGIDGLKIEGRMKSPEYVWNVTRLYREILDRGDQLLDEEYQELVRRADLSFAREKTTGWLHAPAGTRLIGVRYPGHLGTALGIVDFSLGREIGLRLGADLSLRDGLGFFLEGAAEPVIFSVARIRKAGRDVNFARKGDTVTVEVPREAGEPLPARGTEIRHLSSRFLDLPQPKEAAFPLWKKRVDMEVGLTREGRLTVQAAGFPAFTGTVTIDRASHRKPFIRILARLFAESGDSLFVAGKLSLSNTTGFEDDGIFVPPSELKRFKNELYAFLETAFISRIQTKAGHERAQPLPAAPCPIDAGGLQALSHRQIAGPAGCASVPFACSDPRDIQPQGLPLHAGFRWLPLPPVMVEQKPWEEALTGLMDANPDVMFAVGLNNLSHLAIASALSAKSNAWFFADFYLYAANSRTISLLKKRVPRLLFAYSWIEGEAGGIAALRVASDFRPPLFYSLGCFARHALNDGRCFDGCPKDFVRDLRQGKNRFQLVVRDCVTYLFAVS
jgi:U32 family peptidase